MQYARLGMFLVVMDYAIRNAVVVVIVQLVILVATANVMLVLQGIFLVMTVHVIHNVVRVIVQLVILVATANVMEVVLQDII